MSCAWITAVEVVTLLARGKMQTAKELREEANAILLKRDAGQRRRAPDGDSSGDPRFSDDFAISRAADFLIQQARAERIELWGIRKAPGRGEMRLGKDELSPSLTINYLHNTLEPDPDAAPSWEIALAMSCTDLRVRRADAELLRYHWAAITSDPSTAGAELRLQAWLMPQMADQPTRPRPKAEMKERARQEGHSISGRAFDRVWRKAAQATGASAWIAPGARARS